MSQAKSLKSRRHVYVVGDGDLLSHHFIIKFFLTLSAKKKKGRNHKKAVEDEASERFHSASVRKYLKTE